MSVDDALNQAFETLNGRLRAELRAAADEIASTIKAERERQPPAAVSPPRSAAPDGDRTLHAIRAIGDAGSLSEVLDTLAGSAAHEASRAGVLLLRGERLHGWRFVGFPSSFDASGTVDIPLSEAGRLAAAVHTGAAVAGSVAPRFADLPEGKQCVAVPIMVGGQAVAVLYADDAPTTVRLPPSPPSGSGATGKPDTTDEGRNGWQSRVEVLARFASRCLEAITAFRTARLLQERAGGAGEAGQSTEGGDAGDPDAAARRYARLLVSEIKLYHEPDVIAGRRERDLGTRLGAEIARARMLYEQRVPPQIGRRNDYFQAELVRTLADGDAALLQTV
jgi:hypothetical protein